MRPHSIIRTLAATALIALPSLAMAAPDQNTNNSGCPNGQWRNSQNQCVNNGNNGNGQWNNGRNNNNGQWNNGRHRDRDDRDDRNRRDNDDRNNRRGNNNGGYNNGGYNNGGYNNGGYNNGGYNNGNRGGQLSGQVSSFSPYNLVLSNGTHVVLHNGTVINPTGTNLTSGQRVRVIGNWNQDGTFNANEIDVTTNGYGSYRR
ncbi:MAG TPA: DUF5666 domain-containing protein [Candidatus Elarobacter sp.]